MYSRNLLLSQLVAAIALIAAVLLGLRAANAESPMIISPDGKYLGNLNNNPYDPNSVSNPYGRYGNPYSPDSVNNPYGRYGNPYSPDSARNPFTLGPSRRR